MARYVANDGKEFNNQKDAISHNTYVAGLAEERKGNKQEAINYYTSAIKSFNLEPYGAYIHYIYVARARTYLNSGNLDLAEKDIEGVLAQINKY